MVTKRVATFQPNFTITPATATALMRIEATRQAIETLPITPRVLANMRETARLFSTHYSTMIEGNRLTQEQVAEVIVAAQHFPGRDRDEAEVKGYYAALSALEVLAAGRSELTQAAVQKLHALVMGGGRRRVKPSAYRDGQNVIRDIHSKAMVYLPPEAKDVSSLMVQLISWINGRDGMPIPLVAALAHYQFATIHPYYDGNGRTARLLATLVLHRGGYGLKGLYAPEEYYARDLKSYYEALTVGPSHNYYLGRSEADVTRWVSYFIEGMALSFEAVKAHAERESLGGRADRSRVLRGMDARQRKVLPLFERSLEVTTKEIGDVFALSARSAALLCRRWVGSGFLIVTDQAKKTRRYRLGDDFEAILKEE